MLEMFVSILIGLAIERAGLHHRNETHLNLEIFSSSVDRWPDRDIVSREIREFTESLLGMTLEVD
jgi:hypothetical protein